MQMKRLAETDYRVVAGAAGASAATAPGTVDRRPAAAAGRGFDIRGGTWLLVLPAALLLWWLVHLLPVERAWRRPWGHLRLLLARCPPWRAKRRRVVPGSREATRDTRRAEGAKGDPKGASRTAGAPMSCRRSSRFWGLGCPKIFHEIEDSLVTGWCGPGCRITRSGCRLDWSPSARPPSGWPPVRWTAWEQASRRRWWYSNPGSGKDSWTGTPTCR